MDYLFPSLLFIKDNIRSLIEDINYSNGKIDDSVNHLINSMTLNECHRVMISNDSISKKSLKLIVSEHIQKYLVDYRREHRYSIDMLNFNFDQEMEKLNTLFWKLVSEVS